LLGNRASPAELAPPAEVVAELNRRFQGDDDSYFTILYGTIDTRNLRLCFCQAGHPGPILLPYSGKPTLLGHGGFPVGMVLEMDYEEELVQLNAGDRIVLHSDGITECQNPQGERYSDERLFKVLENHKDQPLKTIVESVQRDVSAWRGQAEFADDISLLILECT
jgi:phosphoserine phosphatase RsbU/P